LTEVAQHRQGRCQTRAGDNPATDGSRLSRTTDDERRSFGPAFHLRAPADPKRTHNSATTEQQSEKNYTPILNSSQKSLQNPPLTEGQNLPISDLRESPDAPADHPEWRYRDPDELPYGEGPASQTEVPAFLMVFIAPPKANRPFA
jgi:hypothetical protein